MRRAGRLFVRSPASLLIAGGIFGMIAGLSAPLQRVVTEKTRLHPAAPRRPVVDYSLSGPSARRRRPTPAVPPAADQVSGPGSASPSSRSPRRARATRIPRSLLATIRVAPPAGSHPVVPFIGVLFVIMMLIVACRRYSRCRRSRRHGGSGSRRRSWRAGWPAAKPAAPVVSTCSHSPTGRRGSPSFPVRARSAADHSRGAVHRVMTVLPFALVPPWAYRSRRTAHHLPPTAQQTATSVIQRKTPHGLENPFRQHFGRRRWVTWTIGRPLAIWMRVPGSAWADELRQPDPSASGTLTEDRPNTRPAAVSKA